MPRKTKQEQAVDEPEAKEPQGLDVLRQPDGLDDARIVQVIQTDEWINGRKFRSWWTLRGERIGRAMVKEMPS